MGRRAWPCQPGTPVCAPPPDTSVPRRPRSPSPSPASMVQRASCKIEVSVPPSGTSWPLPSPRPSTRIWQAHPCRGWQCAASRVIDEASAAQLAAVLDPASRTMLDSQSGPFAARVFTALLTSPDVRLDSAAFSALLLRRLRLLLPLDAASCGVAADACGDHRAACPRSGLLRLRGAALERAAARVCRGAQVAVNVLPCDLNVHRPSCQGAHLPQGHRHRAGRTVE